jgi:two-component system, response regulator PdtaR
MKAHRLHHLVETMVRAGADERAVVDAVEAATAGDPPASRVLVVEDDPLVRGDVAGILAEAGFEICGEASDGRQAVALALRRRPDAIVMDANMPYLDGVEAARRILAVHRVPIVMLTGYSYGELIDRALDAGVAAYVVKPFAESEVVGAVTAALARAA